MSKYDPLWKYINNYNEDEITLTFDNVKEILGFEIDHSFLNYKKELSEYNYNVKIISLKEKKIIFKKTI